MRCGGSVNDRDGVSSADMTDIDRVGGDHTGRSRTSWNGLKFKY